MTGYGAPTFWVHPDEGPPGVRPSAEEGLPGRAGLAVKGRRVRAFRADAGGATFSGMVGPGNGGRRARRHRESTLFPGTTCGRFTSRACPDLLDSVSISRSRGRTTQETGLEVRDHADRGVLAARVRFLRAGESVAFSGGHRVRRAKHSGEPRIHRRTHGAGIARYADHGDHRRCRAGRDRHRLRSQEDRIASRREPNLRPFGVRGDPGRTG